MAADWEERERRAKYDREHPIYGTDFSRPLPDIIEKLRMEITRIRGSLGDIGRAYPGWDERVEPIEGLLTCGLVALFHVRAEMLKVQATEKPPSEGLR